MTEQLAIPDFPKPELQRREIQDSDLVRYALEHNAGIDVVERLMALRERERDHAAKVSFDEALNRCQGQLSRIAADASNEGKKYATYAKLDKVVRPIYTGEGFSISFGERDCPNPAKTRFVAFLSRAGVTREYLKDMTPSTKGPKGNDVMTPIHADGAADSYAKRYLLKDIFNIAIGEEDTDGVTNGELVERIEFLMNCSDLAELEKLYKAYWREFEDNPAAIKTLRAAKDARKKELS